MTDEYDYEEYVTFAEMFEEVKLYAAAFKKNGLKKGDRVSCWMSNRKEAIFAYLAALSIGAIFGGPHPFMGSRASSHLIQKMDPKFLIAIDHHSASGTEYHSIEMLPDIVEKSPTLEKVIIVPTRPETLTRNISNIRNSCFLENFLNSGRTPDGKIPDIEFEQLPFDHPISINFTSGTSGLPKEPVHAAGTLLPHMVNPAFFSNLKKGDVIYSYTPVGWIMWDGLIPFMAWGMTLFVFAGNPIFERRGSNLWDVFSRYNVAFAYLDNHTVDQLEKYDIIPRPNARLDSLKVIGIGGSPVKIQNCMFLRNKIKRDMFISSKYGCTEIFGTLSGNDLNSPCYAGEIQVPAIGMDLRCFDEEGNSVVNKRGIVVVAKPTPSFPIYLWKDKGNSVLKKNYLSKYPGVWCQNDECWINPETKGVVITGRSDDGLIQKGERFGAEDIYTAIHDVEGIQDSICVSHVKRNGDSIALLFIKMENGYSLTPEFREKIEERIGHELLCDCIPEVILEIKDIPYNLNKKKMESIVRKIISTNKIPDVYNIKNPESLKYFCDIPEIVSCN